MESRKPLIIVIINILLGVSWALVALGALLAYDHSRHLDMLSSLVFTFFGMVGGFLCVVFFEMCLIQYEKLQEARKQTKLLSDIREALGYEEETKKSISDALEIHIDKLSDN